MENNMIIKTDVIPLPQDRHCQNEEVCMALLIVHFIDIFGITCGQCLGYSKAMLLLAAFTMQAAEIRSLWLLTGHTSLLQK
jgi:hypothetical protein